MSEYQCYEFLALDRPLSKKEMVELREISTRAKISPTRFWNEYQCGNLRADPAKLVERYFDAHLYFANWGTHRLMLRIPASGVDAKRLCAYFVGDPAKLRVAGSHLIFDLQTEDEGGGDFEDYEEEEGSLAALAPLRVELMQGDLRGAYLAWLLAVQSGRVQEQSVEPALPRGLAQLTSPQRAMAEFLRIDEDLISVAAADSGQVADDLPTLLKWARALAPSAKDDWLRRAIEEPAIALGAELRQAFRAEAPQAESISPRTAAELLLAAEKHREQRERAATKRAERATQVAHRARNRQLDELAKRVDGVWAKLEGLVKKSAYEEAIQLAIDLRDLAVRDGASDAFSSRFKAMKKRQLRRRAFFERWRRESGTREW
jgi:hypothetical protein